MKIFLDNRRSGPTDAWVSISSYADFKKIVDQNAKIITHLSASSSIDGINDGVDAIEYVLKQNKAVEVELREKTKATEDRLCRILNSIKA